MPPPSSISLTSRTLSGALPTAKRPPLLSGKSAYVLGVNIGERRIGVGTERGSGISASRRTGLRTSHELPARGAADAAATIAIDCSSSSSSQSEDVEETIAEVPGRISSLLNSADDIASDQRQSYGEVKFECEMSGVVYSSDENFEVKEHFAETNDNPSGIYGSSLFSASNSNNFYGSYLRETKYESGQDFDASSGVGTHFDGSRMESDDAVVACFNRMQDRECGAYLLNSPEKENISLGYFLSGSNNSAGYADSGIGSQELASVHGAARPKPLFTALSFVPDSPEKKTRRITHDIEVPRQY